MTLPWTPVAPRQGCRPPSGTCKKQRPDRHPASFSPLPVHPLRLTPGELPAGTAREVPERGGRLQRIP
eukprot:4187607-Pyramimonas_sp.AAC.1